MIEEIRELLQTLSAPRLEGIKGDICALDAKFDVKFETVGIKIDGVDSKAESHRRELLAEIRRVGEVLSANFVRLEEKVDLRLGSMKEKIELHRLELLAEIRVALK